jgi:hypothetical protein
MIFIIGFAEEGKKFLSVAKYNSPESARQGFFSKNAFDVSTAMA